MEARITVKMDNAAFADEPASELARILRALADHVESGEPGTGRYAVLDIRDVNGNVVGQFEVH